MYLQLNTRFNPFTYDEMVKPLLYYQAAYDKVDAAYSELEKQTEMWRNIANREKSPEAFAMYQRYSNDLANAASSFSQGMTAQNRSALMGLKRRYASDIQPIATAYARQTALADEQRKAELANPTIRWERKASDMSLDDFIRNPSLDYGRSYSGALLTQQVSQAAAYYAKTLTEEGGLEKLGLPYQYKSRIRHGASPSEILAVINDAALEGHQGAVNFLKSIRDQVINSSGIADWADPVTFKELIAFANQGLYSALGQTEIKNYTDSFSSQNALNALQSARSVAAQKEIEANKLKMNNPGPTSLYGTSEVSEMNKATLKELNTWRNKGYINSKGQLTKKGWTAINNQLLYDISGAANSDSPYVRGKAYSGRDAEFTAWATHHGVKYVRPQKIANLNKQGKTYYTYSNPKLTGYGDMTNYYNSTMNSINSGQLVTGTPNIDVYRQGIKSDETRRYILDKVTASLAGGNIFKVGKLNVSKNGEVTMNKGNAVSAKEFKEAAKDNPILYVINSPTTNNQLIEMTDGTKYIMPKGVLDNFNWENLNRVGDPNDPNSQLGNNQRLKYAASDYEKAIILNQSQSYLGSLLDSNIGTEVATSDGTISVW